MTMHSQQNIKITVKLSGPQDRYTSNLVVVLVFHTHVLRCGLWWLEVLIKVYVHFV
jgi:hypothetical protein